MPPTTVSEVLKRVVKRFPNKAALRVKRNGEWVTWTWKGYYNDVAAVAKSLVRVGLESCHGVCVLGFNAPEWFIAYIGGIMVRRVSITSFLPTQSGKFVIYHLPFLGVC